MNATTDIDTALLDHAARSLTHALGVLANPAGALPDAIPSGAPSRARADTLLRIRNVMQPDDLADDPAQHTALSWAAHRKHLPTECSERIGRLLDDCDRAIAACLPVLTVDDCRDLGIVRIADFPNGAVFRSVDMRGNNPISGKGQVYVACLEALPVEHWLRPDPRFFEHWRLTLARASRPLPGHDGVFPPKAKPAQPTPFQLERERQHAERLARMAAADRRHAELAEEIASLPCVIKPSQCVRVALPTSAIEQPVVCLGAPLRDDCRAWLTLNAVRMLTDVQAARQRIQDEEAALNRHLAETRQKQQDDLIRQTPAGRTAALELEVAALRQKVATLRGDGA